MKSFLRFIKHMLIPVRRRWLRFQYDDRFRLARRQSRASRWTYRVYRMEFLRTDYAVLLKACGVSKKDTMSFMKEAALQYAHFVLDTNHLGGPQ